MMHQIAREVYNSKQVQVLDSKQDQASANISGHNLPILPDPRKCDNSMT